MSKKKDVVEKATSKEVAVASTPDYLSQYGSKGNESVGMRDIVIPRLGLLQALSPELDSDSPKYIEEAEKGMFFNSLTREVYPTPVSIVFVDRRKEYIVFRKRKAGGGFKGSFTSEDQARQALTTFEGVPPEQLEIVEQATNFGLIINADNSLTEIVVPMSSTKLKIDRQINSMLRLRGGPRFGSIFFLDSVAEKNDKGSFYNIKATIGPWVSESVAKAAMSLYDAIHSGDRQVDYDSEPEATAEERF